MNDEFNSLNNNEPQNTEENTDNAVFHWVFHMYLRCVIIITHLSYLDYNTE